MDEMEGAEYKRALFLSIHSKRDDVCSLRLSQRSISRKWNEDCDPSKVTDQTEAQEAPLCPCVHVWVDCENAGES
jgi:hypothetical protein